MTTKITDPDLLRVGTELIIDQANLTFQLVKTGNLGNEGVQTQALYSKFKELWLSMPYQSTRIPMYSIDSDAGKYQIGTDGTNYHGWKPLDDTTRQLLRDGGWEEYDAAGNLLRVYVGIVTLGAVDATDQLHYQRAAGGPARDFVFAGAVNEGVQVYGNAANGNFDERTYFKVFSRTSGKRYAQSDLATIGESATGPRKMTFAVSNDVDAHITAADALMSSAPYNGITITYYAADQSLPIGGVNYPFRVVIAGNGATKGQIYTKVQYLLRQNADIDSGAGVTTGKTADALLSYDGDTLVTARGVIIQNYDPNDTNGIRFTDQNNVARTEPFIAAGSLVPNTNLIGDPSAVYRMVIASTYGVGAAAVTVKDAGGSDIAGSISGRAAIPFTFAYDSNTQSGHTAGTDLDVIVIATGTSGAKFVTAAGTLKRATGQTFALVSEKERSYRNPA
jgi:hypothetical protein